MNPWVVANWKMNGTASLVEEANTSWQSIQTNANLIFCPPACWLHLVKPHATHFHLGGQACHAANEGAYTGNISAGMLKELGCQYVLIGHSEQRPCDVRGALITAHSQGLTPIWCLGHRHSTPSRFDYIEECEYLARTIELERPPFDHGFMIAYEPFSAIGTGQPMDPDIVKVIIEHIKRLCNVPVLYGGSVNESNISQFLQASDGVLIGGMSLNIQKMKTILEAI